MFKQRKPSVYLANYRNFLSCLLSPVSCLLSYISCLLSCISSLVSSCLVFFCLLLSCLLLPSPFSSCLLLSSIDLSCLVLSCLVLSCLVLSCLPGFINLYARARVIANPVLKVFLLDLVWNPFNSQLHLSIYTQARV